MARAVPADNMERKVMCARGSPGITCDAEEGNMAPVIILFLAQLVSGIGGSLYYTIGVSYMDDNIKKEKTPALISESAAVRSIRVKRAEEYQKLEAFKRVCKE